MAKYMSTVLHTIVANRIVVPKCTHALLKFKYSSKTDECYDNDDNRREIDNVDQKQQRLLKVAIIGVPNSGKSSLINSIVQRNICPYSCKVHTTRSSARAVESVGDTQLVFLDTPGLVDSKEIKKFNLEKTFTNDSINAIDEADIIGVIHDVSNRYTRNHLDPKVLRLLHLYSHKDSFLVLNKIDLLKSKSQLLDLARLLTCNKHGNLHIPDKYSMTSEEEIVHKVLMGQERMMGKLVRQSSGWDKFLDVFMVSAILNHGSTDIKEYLLQKSKPSPWIFPKDMISDQKDFELVQSMIRSTLFDDLPNEVPYKLKIEIEYYEVSREGNIHIVVLIGCDTPRIEKLIMGKKGRRIKNIARSCEQRLRNMFMTDVFLKMVITKKSKSFNSHEMDPQSQ